MPPRGPWLVMQVRFGTNLTSEQYIRQQAWQQATLERCPLHPEGGCGVRGHGRALTAPLPELFGTAPRIAALRERLGMKAGGGCVLSRLRAMGEHLLPQLRAPLGFFRARRLLSNAESELQHKVGPDPGGGRR